MFRSNRPHLLKPSHLIMKNLIVVCLVLLLGSFQVSKAVEWGDLRSTFSALDIFRMASFYQLPRTVPEAKGKGWDEPKETKQDFLLTTLCEKNDGTVCLLYDNKGSIAGYQIGIPTSVDNLAMPGINYEKKGFTKGSLFGQELYIIRAFFVPQDSINHGGRTWDGQTGVGLWLPINGRLQEIPLKEKDIANKIPAFKKQNCYEKMGRHYFYNISRTMTPEDFQPLYVMYNTAGDLIGWGFNGVGSNVVKTSLFSTKKNWFEFVPTFKVRQVAPDIPDWALKYMNNYGSYLHHVYLVPEPWKLKC